MGGRLESLTISEPGLIPTPSFCSNEVSAIDIWYID
jgi:hypothetical protein